MLYAFFLLCIGDGRCLAYRLLLSSSIKPRCRSPSPLLREICCVSSLYIEKRTVSSWIQRKRSRSSPCLPLSLICFCTYIPVWRKGLPCYAHIYNIHQYCMCIIENQWYWTLAPSAASTWPLMIFLDAIKIISANHLPNPFWTYYWVTYWERRNRNCKIIAMLDRSHMVQRGETQVILDELEEC